MSNAFDFIKDCVNKSNKAHKKRQNALKSGKQYPKMGFGDYAMGSAIGDRPNAAADSGSSFSSAGMVAAMGTSSIGTAPAAPAGPCEAIDKNIDAIMEAYPSSPVVDEIRKAIHDLQEGNFTKLYHGCDKIQCEAQAVPVDEKMVTSLAASCESALSAFHKYTGVDYLSVRDK